MKIQSFIFCWNDYINAASKLEYSLSLLGKATVINSNIHQKKDGWINLNDGYFGEQWNMLIENIDSDTDFIFHIQADASLVDYYKLFAKFKSVFNKYDVGIYSPNIIHTWYSYKMDKIEKLEDNLYIIPNTDCTCWFINTKLIDKAPLFDLKTNSIGYGADWYYSAKSKIQNKLVIRDYSFTCNHPMYKGYNHDTAMKMFDIWVAEQSNDIKHEMFKLMEYMNSANINL